MNSQTILILGGTGMVGRVVVKTALSLGYKVRSITREISKVKKLKLEGAEWIQGSVFDQSVLDKAVEGVGAVISVLGPKGMGHTNIYSESARLVIGTMKKYNVQRYLAITPGKTSDNMGCMMRAMMNKFLTKLWIDANKMKGFFETRNDEINWTVVQPFPLSGSKASNKYRVANGHISPPLKPKTIIADLADFLVTEAFKNNWNKQTVTIGM